MAIYTKQGDGGVCSLYSGERVPKSHPQTDALGELDELIAAIGVLKAMLPAKRYLLINELEQIQKDIFVAAAWLSTSPSAPSTLKLQALDEGRVRYLEHRIDSMQKRLPPITNFILPGGHIISAYIQLARSICRRAERRVVGLSGMMDLANPSARMKRVTRYINRLSDYLFILGIHCNQTIGVPERFWRRPCSSASNGDFN